MFSLPSVLEGVPSLDFALLFGSYAEGRATGVSDLDVGIHTNREISILDLGSIACALEDAASKKVDLVLLNGLYRRQPSFAFELVARGKLIFCRSLSEYVAYKKNTYLYYLDSAYLLRLVDRSFQRRLEERRIGERNYVG